MPGLGAASALKGYGELDRTWLFLLLLAVDLAFGFAVGHVTATRAEPSSSSEETPRAVASAGSTPTLPRKPVTAGVLEDVDAIRRQVVELEEQLQLYTSLEETYERELYGARVPWPEELDGKYRDEQFKDHVNHILEECETGMAIVGFDCSEPPCYVHMVGPEESASIGGCPQWRDLYGGTVSSATLTIDCADGSEMRVRMVAPDMSFLWDESDEERGFDSDRWKRFSKRTKDAHVSIICPQDRIRR